MKNTHARFSVLQEDFAPALAAAVKMTDSKSLLPALSRIHIQTDRGRVRVSATDTQMGLSLTIAASVDRDGEFLLPAKHAADMAAIEPSIRIDLQDCPDQKAGTMGYPFVMWTCGANTVKFYSTVPVADYPLLPNLNRPAEAEHDTLVRELTALLDDLTIPAASDDHFVVWADGHNLWLAVGVGGVMAGHAPAVTGVHDPLRLEKKQLMRLKAALKKLDKDEALAIWIADQSLVIESVHGTYWLFGESVNLNSNHRYDVAEFAIEVTPGDLSRALTRLNKLKADKIAVSAAPFEGTDLDNHGSLRLTAKTPQTGTVEVVVPGMLMGRTHEALTLELAPLAKVVKRMATGPRQMVSDTLTVSGAMLGNFRIEDGRRLTYHAHDLTPVMCYDCRKVEARAWQGFVCSSCQQARKWREQLKQQDLSLPVLPAPENRFVRGDWYQVTDPIDKLVNACLKGKTMHSFRLPDRPRAGLMWFYEDRLKHLTRDILNGRRWTMESIAMYAGNGGRFPIEPTVIELPSGPTIYLGDGSPDPGPEERPLDCAAIPQPIKDASPLLEKVLDPLDQLTAIYKYTYRIPDAVEEVVSGLMERVLYDWATTHAPYFDAANAKANRGDVHRIGKGEQTLLAAWQSDDVQDQLIAMKAASDKAESRSIADLAPAGGWVNDRRTYKPVEIRGRQLKFGISVNGWLRNHVTNKLRALARVSGLDREALVDFVVDIPRDERTGRHEVDMGPIESIHFYKNGNCAVWFTTKEEAQKVAAAINGASGVAQAA